MKIQTSCFDLAQRYVAMEEIPGQMNNPAILAMLHLDGNSWVKDDETAWCSAFANWIAWHLRLPRSKSLAARSWLQVGRPIPIEQAEPDNDVVIFKRGAGIQPGPEVIKAPGHVAFFAAQAGVNVIVLGGNQDDQVCLMPYKRTNILGVRRLHG